MSLKQTFCQNVNIGLFEQLYKHKTVLIKTYMNDSHEGFLIQCTLMLTGFLLQIICFVKKPRVFNCMGGSERKSFHGLLTISLNLNCVSSCFIGAKSRL